MTMQGSNPSAPPDSQVMRDPAEQTGRTHPTNGAGSGQSSPSLLTGEEMSNLRSRWDEIQRAFVDDPRAAAARADELLSETIRKISNVIERERSRLNDRWNGGAQVSTDEIRVALQRYRSLFHWLLELQPGFRSETKGGHDGSSKGG
jgi:hypothetical protein